jgi:hypothetical protein
MAKITPKTKAGKSRAWENLAKELKSLIPKLDEEGLAFLVKQSQVHLYNMQVDVLNKTIIKDEQRRQVSAPKKAAKKKEAGFGSVKLSESGSGYFISFNGEWITFTKDEISTMVKIVLDKESAVEIQTRFYNWLLRERGDVINTASIADKFDDNLKAFIRLLKNNFKLKK